MCALLLSNCGCFHNKSIFRQLISGRDRYNLNKGQNGIDLNLINGINFNNNFFTGVGIGYLNFEGINGVSVFTDFEYLPMVKKLAPLINLKIGYNHIWNQYENGRGTVMFELSGGVNHKLTEKLDCYFKVGLLMTQQSFLIPIRLGFRF